MANELSGRTILFLTANEGVEQVELTRPWQAIEEAGGRPVLAAPKDGTVQAFNHLEAAGVFRVDRRTHDLNFQDYDGLVLPGGVANPDQLRMDDPAICFVKDFCAAGKPVAAICHGPWTLIEAEVVSGRTLTSWPSLQTDIRNAGATWVDEPVTVCTAGPNALVTSRKPDDLDVFCEEMIKAFGAGSAGPITR